MDVAACEHWYAAYNARDVQGLCALAHPEVELIPTRHFAPAGTSYHGHDGIRSLAAHTWSNFPAAAADPKGVRHVNEATVVALDITLAEDEPTREAVAVFEFDNGLIRRIQAFDTEAEAAAAIPGASQPRRLTPREREVFQLLAEGLSAPQIADRLCLSPLTVRTHVQNGMGRLGANTRVQAIAVAVARGEIEASGAHPVG
jgi:DNA-binding CsgD family transcriptional regulator